MRVVREWAMFTFGEASDTFVNFQIVSVLSLIGSLMLMVTIQKAFELGIISFLVCYILVSSSLIGYCFNESKLYFYSIKIIQGQKIELEFLFPNSQKKIIDLNEVKDIKFGVKGSKKYLESCYMNIYFQNYVFESQNKNDCNSVKSATYQLNSLRSNREK
jgi:hypothetical protein